MNIYIDIIYKLRYPKFKTKKKKLYSFIFNSQISPDIENVFKVLNVTFSLCILVPRGKPVQGRNFPPGRNLLKRRQYPAGVVGHNGLEGPG